MSEDLTNCKRNRDNKRDLHIILLVSIRSKNYLALTNDYTRKEWHRLFLSSSDFCSSISSQRVQSEVSFIWHLLPLLLVLFLMIALSLITLTTDCPRSQIKSVVSHMSYCHMSGIIIFRLLIERERKVCPRYKLPRVRCQRDSRKK